MWVLASQCVSVMWVRLRAWVLALQCERDLSCTLMKISLTDSLFASPLWVILTLLALHSSLPHPVFYAYSAAACTVHHTSFKPYIIHSITPLVAKHFTSLTLNLSLIHLLWVSLNHSMWVSLNHPTLTIYLLYTLTQHPLHITVHHWLCILTTINLKNYTLNRHT